MAKTVTRSPPILGDQSLGGSGDFWSVSCGGGEQPEHRLGRPSLAPTRSSRLIKVVLANSADTVAATKIASRAGLDVWIAAVD
jgi:hypothetical protein